MAGRRSLSPWRQPWARHRWPAKCHTVEERSLFRTAEQEEKAQAFDESTLPVDFLFPVAPETPSVAGVS